MSSQLENDLIALAPLLSDRSSGQCELCESKENLAAYAVTPVAQVDLTSAAYLCNSCSSQIDSGELDKNHWFCLNQSVWTQEEAVQVLVYRLLTQLNSEDWASELLEQMYLEDAVKEKAEAGIVEANGPKVIDSNGAQLKEGDTVTIIKDLDVKGTSFVAKRGTTVRGIHLGNDPALVEGRVNGTLIYLRADFLKKV
jgi:protein PhnA